MGLGETDLSKDGISAVASMISCSICLEVVADNGDRSTAKLQCGHEFHLDCIGSAFNAKGLMQCPNCRKIEKGQWLYANGCRSFPEFSVDDWTTHDEDLYDHSYSEMPFGVHWCPYGGLTRLSSSFEEGESPSTAYHDLLGQRAIFTEHTVASSVGHSCPYIAYFHPLHHSTSNSTESVADVASFHHHWSSLSGLGEHTASHTFPSVDTHYRHWEHHSPSFSPNSQINGTDQASVSSTTMRPVGPDSDGLPSTGSFVHPFLLGHWNGSRAGASVISSMIPPYIGNSRGHSRAHNLRVYHQQLNSQGARAPFFSGARRSNSQRGVAPVGPAPVSSDHSGFNMFPSSGSSGRNLPDAENSAANRFYALERDRFAPYPLVPVDRELGWWGPFHQGAGGSDSGSRNGFWQRNGSERSSSQGRTDNSSFHPVHLSQMHPYL